MRYKLNILWAQKFPYLKMIFYETQHYGRRNLQVKLIFARIYPIHFLAENCYHKGTTLSFLCFIFVKVKLERNGTCMYAVCKYIQYEEGTAYNVICLFRAQKFL